MYITQGDIVNDDNTTDAIFTKEEIFTTVELLARLLRKIFVDNNITYPKFREMHKKYMQGLGASTPIINYNWNNLRKAIIKDKITFHMFHYVITALLDLNISDIAITTQSRENVEKVYRLKVNK